MTSDECQVTRKTNTVGRRGGAYHGGRELAESVGQNAERQETRDNARRPLRDGNFPGKMKLMMNFSLPLAGCRDWIKLVRENDQQL